MTFDYGWMTDRRYFSTTPPFWFPHQLMIHETRWDTAPCFVNAIDGKETCDDVPKPNARFLAFQPIVSCETAEQQYQLNEILLIIPSITHRYNIQDFNRNH